MSTMILYLIIYKNDFTTEKVKTSMSKIKHTCVNLILCILILMVITVNNLLIFNET